MKKTLTILMTALLCVVAFMALTACGKTNNPPADPCAISSASMILMGDHLSLEVPNTTTEFSFLDDITVPDGARYVVARDKYCENVFHAKIAPLNSGDNHFYILVTNGDAMKLYTVTIRRLPL